MAKTCSKCGESISNDSKFCKNCGEKQTIEGEIIEESTNKQKVPVNALSITGFVFAMVSLISCGLVSPLGLIFSIIGLAKGDPEDRTGKGLAIAGIIVSAIMLLLCILMLIVFKGLWNLWVDIVNGTSIDFNNIISYGFLVK